MLVIKNKLNNGNKMIDIKKEPAKSYYKQMNRFLLSGNYVIYIL